MAGVFKDDRCVVSRMGGEEYSILIVGMFGIPSHLDRFIRNLKRTNPSARISLFSDRDKGGFSPDTHDCIDEYIKRKKYTGWPHRVWKFRAWFDRLAYVRQFKDLSRTHHFDIVNIHYPTYILGDVMRFIRKMADTIVVSPWGSDVLRIDDPRKKRRLSAVFKNADVITVSSSGLFAHVLCEEMRIDRSKFHPLGWGSETIDYINEHISELTREEAKARLHLEGKYLITCGYNAFEEQRHELILNAIRDRKEELPDNLLLLLPLTYGSSYGTKKQQYVARLKALCDELRLPVVFFERFLSLPEIFLLRRATDMFIHIQPTDGGNSSLQEYVLCGAKVVHGAWIHYAGLEQYEPLFYFPVRELEDLGDVIVDAYKADPIRIPAQVMDYIRNRGWKAKMRLWNDYFVSLIKY